MTLVEKDLYAAYIGESVWKPGANTIVYYPLGNDRKDYSGNGYHLSSYAGSDGAITFTTFKGVNCAKSPGKSYFYSENALLPSGGSDRTISLWMATLDTTTRYMFYYGEYTSNVNTSCYVFIDSNYIKFENLSSGIIPEINKRKLITATSSSGIITVYVNGKKEKNKQLALNTTAVSSSYPLKLFAGNSTSYTFDGYLSNVIVEDRCWSAGEVLDYFNGLKSTYGAE